jgi:hypothetical protein
MCICLDFSWPNILMSMGVVVSYVAMLLAEDWWIPWVDKRVDKVCALLRRNR